MHLANRARSIFEELGYDVRMNGARGEFRAERDWKQVTVRAVADPGEAAPAGDLCCFVTDDDTAEPLVRRLEGSEDGAEFAVISVDGRDGYEVVRAPRADQ
ncbi:hypothetical protein BRD00_10190 [Halobacteriales archaeon QS_8_69_26]|nr:MAG: hypothetical protein BRD00_10190 [Halobacteriales archaeon QS_8_69_26]